MLDDKDLQAIKAMMNELLDAQSEQMKQYVDLIMENEVRPNIRLLAEGQQTILQQLTPRLDDAERRLDRLETEVMLLKSAI